MTDVDGFEACDHEASPMERDDLRRLANKLDSGKHRTYRITGTGKNLKRENGLPWDLHRSIEAICELLYFPLQVWRLGCHNCARRLPVWWCEPPCLDCEDEIPVAWCENTKVTGIAFTCTWARDIRTDARNVGMTCCPHHEPEG